MPLFSRSQSRSSQEDGGDHGIVSVAQNDTLNIRSGPGARTSVVGELQAGDDVELLEQQGGWVRIRSGRGTGWVAGAYIRPRGQQNEAPRNTREAPQPEPEAPKRGLLSRIFGGRDNDKDAEPPARGGWPRELKSLLKRENLNAVEVQRARGMIEALPAEQQGDAWQALQASTPYINQLSVKATGPRHGTGSQQVELGPVICNLTSLAMCLQTLGIPNPDPSQPYPMALEALRVKHAPGVWRGDEASWKRILPHVGASLTQLSTGSSGKLLGRSFWQGTPERELRAGNAIIASISGHVCRIQEISDKGIVADDPAGPSTLTPGTGSAVSWGNGNNRLWPWADVEKRMWRFVGVVRRK